MSTRSTIWYDKKGGEDGNPDLHLYEEMWGDHLALEVAHGPFRLVIKLPKEMVAAMLKSESCAVYAEHGTTDPA